MAEVLLASRARHARFSPQTTTQNAENDRGTEPATGSEDDPPSRGSRPAPDRDRENSGRARLLRTRSLRWQRGTGAARQWSPGGPGVDRHRDAQDGWVSA